MARTPSDGKHLPVWLHPFWDQKTWKKPQRPLKRDGTQKGAQIVSM